MLALAEHKGSLKFLSPVQNGSTLRFRRNARCDPGWYLVTNRVRHKVFSLCGEECFGLDCLDQYFKNVKE